MGNKLCECSLFENREKENNLTAGQNHIQAPIQYNPKQFYESSIPSVKGIQQIFIKNRINTIIRAVREFLKRKKQAKMEFSTRASNKQFESMQKEISSNNLLPLFKEGGHFKGYLENGKKEGFGIIEWTKGSSNITATLTSSFHLDQARGFGKYTTKEGIEYAGQFNYSKANGYGIYKHLNGGVYEGYWENDLQSAVGIETWADGTKYTGNYVNGKKHGIGTYEWGDGSKYQGQWKENALCGYGVYHFKDGRVYIGEWQNNLMHGYGEITWKDGKVYLGFFKKDKKDGFGIYLWTSKQKAFIGFWKNNAQHGLGKFVSEKSVKYGKWVSGSQEKTFDNKDIFDSQLKSEGFSYQFKHFFKHDYQSLDMFIKLFKK